MKCEICEEAKPCGLVEVSRYDGEDWINTMRTLICGKCVDLIGPVVSASVKSWAKKIRPARKSGCE